MSVTAVELSGEMPHSVELAAREGQDDRHPRYVAVQCIALFNSYSEDGRQVGNASHSRSPTGGRRRVVLE